MKYMISFSVLLLLFSFSSLNAQNNKLIENRDFPDADAKKDYLLSKSPANVSVYLVSFNIDLLDRTDHFVLEVGDKNIEVEKEKLEARDINSFSFVGKNPDNMNFIVFSYLDGDIQGIIEADLTVYSIQTVGPGEYAIVKLNQSAFTDGCDIQVKESDNTDDGATGQFSEQSNFDYLETIAVNPTPLMYDCKIRVLVLYTSAAASYVTNIKNTIETAIALTNTSFSNSYSNYTVELAYAGLTNYSETGDLDDDKTRFQNTSDGYLDEVHSLRTKHSADVCVLLGTGYEDCGSACEIGASSSGAFCVVTISCAINNYSFPHEIGHLMGCRHDIDTGSTPLAYGHGYTAPSHSWRTIMAYPQLCNFCPRLLYWSNPIRTYSGEAMGTAGWNNNAYLWDQRANYVMSFKQPSSSLTVTGTDISNGIVSDLIAKQTITTSGTVTLASGKKMNMRAGNTITLQPGFSAHNGSDFSASIEPVTECGEAVSILLSPAEIDTHYAAQDTTALENTGFDYSLAMSSAFDHVTLNYVTREPVVLSVKLLDFRGNTVNIVQNQNSLEKDSYGSFQIPLKGLQPGTYFLTVNSNNRVKTEKIVVNK